MSHHSLKIEKDLTHSYLYLYGKSWKEENHEQKIIQQCSIPGTIPFRLIQEEQEDIFQYNYSPYERMVDYFLDRKMNLSHILSLFESIRSALFYLEEFLLSSEVLGLDIEEIIYDAENAYFLFPLIPSEKNVLKEELKQLIDYVFDHVDESDESAILSVFFLQQEKKKETLQVPQILQILRCAADRKKVFGEYSGNCHDKISHSSEKTSDFISCPSGVVHSFINRPSEEIEKTSVDSMNPGHLSLDKNPDSSETSPLRELDLSCCSYSDYMGMQSDKRSNSPITPLTSESPSKEEDESRNGIKEGEQSLMKTFFSSVHTLFHHKKKLIPCLLILFLFPLAL